MKLLSLEIKGFGPYTSAQSLKYPSQKKVTILGTNGAGKTWILDAVPAALFKAVPNRDGGFYESFSGNDAFIDLTFEMGGQRYRARRLVNAVSRTQKAYLYRGDEALNDGKDAAFAAEVAKLGLNQTAFMAAVYQAQNGAGNVLGMEINERINLLSLILDLVKFDEEHAKVVEAHKALSREIDDLGVRESEVRRQLPDVGALAENRKRASATISEFDRGLAENDAATHEALQSVANARANAQGVDDLKREAANLEAELTADRVAQQDISERIKNNQTLVLEQKEQIQAAVAAIATHRQNIQDKQAETQELQDLAQKAQAGLDQWNVDQRAKIADWTQKTDDTRKALIAAETDLRDAQALRTRIESARKTAEAQAESLRPATELIDRVPCAGTDLNATCELLKSAHAGRVKIEALRAEIGQRTAELEQVEAGIPAKEVAVEQAKTDVQSSETVLKNEMQAQPPAEFTQPLVDFKARIAAANESTAASNAAIAEAEPLAKLADRLEGVEERIAEYNARLEVLNARIATNEAALEGKRKKISEAADIEATIQAAEQRMAALKTERAEIEEKKSAQIETLGRIDAEIEKAATLADQAAALAAKIAEKRETLAEIQILRDGLGPRGAKNVKIDAAGKAITERANRLIRIGLGPQFSIVISTLRELQSKDENGNPEVRETLDLKIINNDTGIERPIGSLSGGEKAMVGLVFSLSLAVEQRQAAGVDTRTLLLDEPSAGLSEENAVKYLEMLDAVLAETGIEQALFISHMPAMQCLADATIIVHKGRDGESSRIEVR